MVDKCHKKITSIFALVYTARVPLEVLNKIHEKLSNFSSSYGLKYIDNRDIRGYTSVKTIFIYYNQVKRFSLTILFRILIVTF